MYTIPDLVDKRRVGVRLFVIRFARQRETPEIESGMLEGWGLE